jgi:hypothetical protein
MRGYAELEFDLPGALLSALLQHFDEMEPADLSAANATAVPEQQGVYALYLKDPQQLVYIGKTDSDLGLNGRLVRHARKILGRRNISPSDIEFKAIRLFVFTAIDLETALIGNFGGVAQVKWNHSGFGSNDPGRRRDTSDYKVGHFDLLYPIELDECFVDFAPGEYPVSEIMQRLKGGLPYTLRFERPGKTTFHADYEASNVNVLHRGMTSREILSLCAAALPPAWHITALPSHIISYRNDQNIYVQGQVL